MENVADALEMAGSVLIFLLALSVSIVSLGQSREATDAVLAYRDRETVYINGDYYYKTTGTERTVSVETIIPTIYRVYAEQYKIVFVFEGSENDPIYTCRYSSGQQEDIRFVLDADFDSNIITTADSRQGCNVFLNAIIYGKKDEEKFKEWYGINASKQVILPSKSLYKRLSEATSIKEYLGVYYRQEVAEGETTEDYEDVESGSPDANKIEKRIITYIIE